MLNIITGYDCWVSNYNLETKKKMLLHWKKLSVHHRLTCAGGQNGTESSKRVAWGLWQFVFRVSSGQKLQNLLIGPLIGRRLVITETSKTLHYSECPSAESKGKLQYVYLHKINLETVIYSNQPLTCTTFLLQETKARYPQSSKFQVCNNRLILWTTDLLEQQQNTLCFVYTCPKISFLHSPWLCMKDSSKQSLLILCHWQPLCLSDCLKPFWRPASF